MLGTEVEFSTCVNQALEIAYSGLFSVSASRWLRTATSRVVIPNLERISLSCSDGFGGSMPLSVPHWCCSSHLQSRKVVWTESKQAWTQTVRAVRLWDGERAGAGRIASEAYPANEVQSRIAGS